MNVLRVARYLGKLSELVVVVEANAARVVAFDAELSAAQAAGSTYSATLTPDQLGRLRRITRPLAAIAQKVLAG